MAGDRTFGEWTTTIINDTDFAIRDALERWMNGINGHNACNTGLAVPVAYEADLKVEQLDREGDVIKTYNFRGAYPQDLHLSHYHSVTMTTSKDSHVHGYISIGNPIQQRN